MNSKKHSLCRFEAKKGAKALEIWVLIFVCLAIFAELIIYTFVGGRASLCIKDKNYIFLSLILFGGMILLLADTIFLKLAIHARNSQCIHLCSTGVFGIALASPYSIKEFDLDFDCIQAVECQNNNILIISQSTMFKLHDFPDCVEITEFISKHINTIVCDNKAQ